jgi:hypothetical protein
LLKVFGGDIRLSTKPGEVPWLDPLQINASESETSTITIESVNGFAGSVNLTATCCLDAANGLPASPQGISVALSTSQIAVPANGKAAFTLTITASAQPTSGQFIAPVVATNPAMGITRTAGVYFSSLPTVRVVGGPPSSVS